MRLIIKILVVCVVACSCSENTIPQQEISLTSKSNIKQALSMQTSVNSIFHLCQNFVNPILMGVEPNYSCGKIEYNINNSDYRANYIRLDFGDNLCNIAGFKYKGKLQISFPNNNSSELLFVFDDFYSSKYKISGELNVKLQKKEIVLISDNLLFVNDTSPVLNLNVYNTYTYLSSNNSVESYSLVGECSFVDSISDEYEFSVNDDFLLLKSNCLYVYSGKANVSINNLLNVSIDYLVDTCDNKVELKSETYRSTINI